MIDLQNIFKNKIEGHAYESKFILADEVSFNQPLACVKHTSKFKLNLSCQMKRLCIRVIVTFQKQGNGHRTLEIFKGWIEIKGICQSKF